MNMSASLWKNTMVQFMEVCCVGWDGCSYPRKERNSFRCKVSEVFLNIQFFE